MEFFFIGFLTIASVIAIIKSRRKRIRLKHIGFRQSMLHHIMKGMIPSNAELNSKKKRQSNVHNTGNVVRVIRTPDSKAYWVEDNIFYYADVVDGQFDPNAKKAVDTSELSKKEINKLLFILDNLKNG
jgi:hypothetical protein